MHIKYIGKLRQLESIKILIKVLLLYIWNNIWNIMEQYFLILDKLKMYLNIFKIYNSSISTNDFIFKNLIELEINNIPIYKLNLWMFFICANKKHHCHTLPCLEPAFLITLLN
jgi:hypothetical protein